MKQPATYLLIMSLQWNSCSNQIWIVLSAKLMYEAFIAQINIPKNGDLTLR